MFVTSFAVMPSVATGAPRPGQPARQDGGISGCCSDPDGRRQLPSSAYAGAQHESEIQCVVLNSWHAAGVFKLD